MSWTRCRNGSSQAYILIKRMAPTISFIRVTRLSDTVTTRKRSTLVRAASPPYSKKDNNLKLICDSRFQRAFTACVCKEITLVGSNQRNNSENTNSCSKCTLKTTVATQL